MGWNSAIYTRSELLAKRFALLIYSPGVMVLCFSYLRYLIIDQNGSLIINEYVVEKVGIALERQGNKGQAYI